MSYLQKLYKEQPSNIKTSIEEYIKAPTNIDAEITALDTLLESETYEKVLAIFSIDILSKSIKKQEDFAKFIGILLKHIEKITNYKNSIMTLRIIRTVINTRFFVPVSYYLIKLLSLAFENEKTKSTGQNFSYDDIRLSSDDLKSEELKDFVIKECLEMLRKNCIVFGSNIGFPEFAFVVCNELRNKCKFGPYKEVIADFIKYINQRKTYIEEERAKIKAEALNGKIIAEFESNLTKWE